MKNHPLQRYTDPVYKTLNLQLEKEHLKLFWDLEDEILDKEHLYHLYLTKINEITKICDESLDRITKEWEIHNGNE